MATIASALGPLDTLTGLDERLNLVSYGLVLPATGAFLDLTATDTPADGADGFSSAFDQFEILDRTASFDFADDSAGSFAPDTFGILGTGDIDPFFGVEDLDNADNPGGTGTARWVFDISGATLDSLSIDVAAFGDFEAGDNSYEIVASVDGGAEITLFSLDADNDDSLTYTLESGTQVVEDDPLKELGADGQVGGGDDTVIDNDFATLTSVALAGLSGSALTVELRAGPNNGGSEVFALRNIVVEGTAAGDPLFETFDTAEGFTTSVPFFSDDGSDYFGLSDGAGNGDFGGADPTLADVKAYQNTDGFFLTGEDLDGEGATPPLVLTWEDIDIAGLTNLAFEGDFAEFFDSPGDIDAEDSLLVEASIDGGAFAPLLAFEGADFSSTSGPFNGVFRQDTDFDGEGDGSALTGAFQTFTAAIAGVGSLLDLRFTADVDSGDEDFAADNFRVFGDGAPAGATFSIAAADADKAEGDAGTAPFTFTVTRAGDTGGAATLDFAVTGGEADAADFGGALPAGTVDFAADQETATVTLDVAGDETPEDDESFEVTLSNASTGTITGASASGVIRNDDAVRIHDVQGAIDFTPTPGAPFPGVGTDDRSPLEGQTVTVEAVVVGDFQSAPNGTANNDLSGFFLQEEDADADGDPGTSEGVFVFDDPVGVDVQEGDLVRVTGTVEEFFGNTQIAATGVEVISAANPLPTPATVAFPSTGVLLDDDGGFVADLEAFEGMLVTVPEAMTVTEFFNLDRFGEYRVSSEGRLTQFTQTNAPDVAGFQAFQEEVAARTVVLDDGRTTQNPDPIELIDGGNGALDANDVFRFGDTLSNVTGPVNYAFDEFRIQDPTGDYAPGNPRPEAPVIKGNLKVASFNVLNYFATIDEGGATTANGNGPRGADSQAELDRQTEKLVRAIGELGADILGLIELENDFAEAAPGNAVARLVSELNDFLGDDIYDWVRPGRQFVDTSDAISVGFIYNSQTVQLADNTTVEILDDATVQDLGLNFGNPVFDGPSTNRAALAATFEEIASGEGITVAVNHYKSKGSVNPAPGNEAAGDGAGNNNAIRLQASEAVDAWLDTDPTGSGDPDVLVIGDLNSYAEEDPVTFLEAEGYTDVVQERIGNEEAYSFVFDGQKGTLDYVLANGSANAQVVDVAEWKINADEPDAFDYNLDFGRDPALFTGSEPFRNSDHDPVVVGLNLESAPDENLVLGTPGIDLFLSGTGEADVIDGLGGRLDRISGLEGDDTFVLTSLLGNGANETLVITDFAPGETLRGVSAAEVDPVSAFFSNDLLLFVNQDDERDIVVLRGAQSIDDVTFEDDPLAIA